MRKSEKVAKESKIDFGYEGKAPPSDLLNYKNMILTEERWATTSSGWGSVLALLLMMVLCVASMVLFRVLLYGWEGLSAVSVVAHP